MSLVSFTRARLGLDALQTREFHRAYYMIILIVKNLESLKLGHLSSCFCFLQSLLSFQIFLTFPALLKIVFDLLFFFFFFPFLGFKRNICYVSRKRLS